MSNAIENFYESNKSNDRLRQIKNNLLRKINSQIKLVNKKIDILNKNLKKEKNMDSIRMKGDLLAANVNKLNKDGNLAKDAKNEKNALAVILDDRTNDKGFAMTSSATSMLLAALIIFDKNFNESILEEIIKLGNKSLSYDEIIENIVKEDFNRVVYLGSGALSYMTTEASLKILELTAGKIATLHDSSAGFRHGPKSFLDEKTIVFNYISNDDYTAKYDIDIINEMKSEKIVKKLVGIGSSRFKESNLSFNIENNIPDAYLSIVYLILGQLFAYKTAIKIDNDVDNPSESGTVNRVVKGVIVHPFE